MESHNYPLITTTLCCFYVACVVPCVPTESTGGKHFSGFHFLVLLALKMLISLISCYVACIGREYSRRQTDRQTHTQNKFSTAP